MHTLSINKTNYYFPENWGEITAQQFLYLCSLTITGINVAELKIKLLLYFTGLQVFKRRARIHKDIEHFFIGSTPEKAWWVSIHDINYAANTLNFLLKEIRDKNGKYIAHDINCQLVANLVPKVETPSRFWLSNKYYGPADGLTNLRFDEYIHAETTLARYRETGKPEHLYQFIAVLYRQPKSKKQQNRPDFDADIRLPFNDAFIENRATDIARIEPVYHRAILLWYEGCKMFLMRQFPNVFKISEQANTEAETNENPFRIFMKLVDFLADSDVIKKPAIRNQYLIDVLESLEQISIKAQKQQEELEKLKPR